MDGLRRLLREPVRWVPWVLAVVPALWMADFVRRGSHLQYADYWVMLPRFLTPSGGLDLGGVFTIHNGHPIAIPQFLYWLNVRAADGSNITLGLVVVAIVFAQVVLISRFVEPGDRRRWAAASVIVVASVLLFSRQGVHNFTKSMSGAAWLTANLFVIAAILARWRDRTWLAIGLGVAASISYGTGLAVWPVVVVVGMVRDRRWVPDWRVVAAGVLVVGLYFVLRPEQDQVPAPGPVDLVQTATWMGGSVLTDIRELAKVLTAVGAAAGIALSAWAVRTERERATPWIGLFLYGGISLALIAYNRELLVSAVGMQSRYASLGAIFWIGLFGLAGAVWGWNRLLLAPAALVVGAAVVFEGPHAQQERDTWRVMDDLASALRLGLEGDGAYTVPMLGPLTVGPLLESSGHYPFSDLWDADCGLLGETIDVDGAERSSTAEVEGVRVTSDGAGIRAIATLPDDTSGPIDCVVVVDDGGAVVGVGTPGVGQPSTFLGMTGDSGDPDRLAAIAPAGATSYTIVAVLDDGTLVQIGDPIDAAALTGP